MPGYQGKTLVKHFLYLHPQSLQTNPNQPDIVLLELRIFFYNFFFFGEISFTWGKIEEISFAASLQKAHPNRLGLDIHPREVNINGQKK